MEQANPYARRLWPRAGSQKFIHKINAARLFRTNPDTALGRDP
jgi:hypothetical protein